MAVLTIKRAAETASGAKTLKGGRTYTAPYHVTVEYATDGVIAVIDGFEAAGLGLGTSFTYGNESDSMSICTAIKPVRKQNSTTKWSCVLTYEPLDEQERKPDEDGELTDQPELWRYSISSSTATYAVPVYKAWNIDVFPKTSGSYTRDADTLGPVVNSAGVTLDPPLMRNANELIYRFSGNLLEYNEDWTEPYIDAINGEQLKWHDTLVDAYGFAKQTHDKYTIKCTSATATCRWWQSQVYWEYAYEFRKRHRKSGDLDVVDGWLVSVLDRGVTRRASHGDPDGAGGTISASDIEDGMANTAPILDVYGRRITEPVLLDGNGQPARGGDERSGVYFRWRVNPIKHFNSIQLDIFAM